MDCFLTLFIEFVTILLLFYVLFFFFWLGGIWDPSSPEEGSNPQPLCWKVKS